MLHEQFKVSFPVIQFHKKAPLYEVVVFQKLSKCVTEIFIDYLKHIEEELLHKIAT